MKVVAGIFLLARVPLAMAKEERAYPKEKLAEFVVEKLDMTSMPLAFRPKEQKGKKTFADYGYLRQKLDDKKTLVEISDGRSQIAIRILEEDRSGIYVCLHSQGSNESSSQVQRVFLLKLKNANGLLKGRESWKELASCPVIGGVDNNSTTGLLRWGMRGDRRLSGSGSSLRRNYSSP